MGAQKKMAVAVAALLLIVSACGDDDDGGGGSATNDDPGTDGGTEQGGTDELLGPEDPASGEPVRIGMISDGQTPNVDNRVELQVAEATAEFWNERRGGIGGRPIEVVTCETLQEPATATDCGNRMIEEDVVAVALSQSGVAESVWEPLHQAGIPTMFFQTNGEGMLADAETSFVLVNPLATQFGLPIGVAESEGADRIAFVTIDVPVALTSFDSGAADSILGNAGLDFDLVTIPPGTADMTSQMQEVVDSGAGVVHLTGNDAFCIAAIQGLTAVGFEGQISAVSQCITDATREAVPDQLEGISILSTAAVGATDDPAYQLYEAVMSTYADDVQDVNNNIPMSAYTVMASLAISLDGIEGDITPQTVAETIKAMPEADFPGADGLTFRCGGSAFEEQPAVCGNGSLRATLDAEGNPAGYETVDSTDILS